VKILAVTSPAKGHLFPIVPTLLELASRGHHVTVRTLAGEVGRMRQLGLDALPLSPGVEGRENDDWKGRTPIEQLRLVFRSWLDRAPHEVVDLRRDVEDRAPDALIIDVNAWGALTAAEATGLPFAVFSPYFLDADLPGRPPFGPGLRPWAGPFGGLRDRIVRFGSRFAMAPGLVGLNHLRAREGLPALGSLAELPLTGGVLLYLTAEPFEYDHGGWSPKVRMVGPGVWEPTGEAWTPPSERPLVLVTCSTEYQSDDRLIEVALEALADEDVHVVATTGAIDPTKFRAPPNATVTAFAPHGPILRRAVAAVCHGGMGITQKALSHGVPVCVVPFGRDQNDVAAHVDWSGAGSRLAPGRLTPARLRDAVRLARSRVDGARRIADAFAAGGGAVAAADAVQSLVGPPVAV
jgi:UDP:flavonoid glycosyltransferase YjiC (YdhE family)